MIFKKQNYIEQHYDFCGVALALKNNEFSNEEIQTLRTIAIRYLHKPNETDAKVLNAILKSYSDESSDFGPAAICKEINRVVA